MNKKHVIIVVILAVALGAVFESFKMVKFNSKPGDGGVNSLLADFDLKPFAQSFKAGNLSATKKNRRKKATRRRPSPNQPMKTLEQLANNQKEQFSFDESPKKNKVAKNSKNKKKKGDSKDGEENEEKEGEDKDKKTAENKEGEKKEGTDADEVADLEKELEDEINKDKDNDVESTSDAFAGGGSGPVPAQNEDEEKAPLSEILAEWANELLKFPDYKLTNKFIGQKQSGQIPDEVFYPIVQMMLEDSRESMRVIGAHCLGATPSAKSFELITISLKSAPFGSRLSTDLSKSSQNYASIQYLSVLREVLYSSENLDSIRSAALLVNQTAVTYLSNTEPVKEGEVSTQEERKERHQSMFEGFISILDSLAQSSSDQDVVSAASQALEQITKYIPQQEDEDLSVVSN